MFTPLPNGAWGAFDLAKMRWWWPELSEMEALWLVFQEELKSVK
jgi:hypothetical protein